MPNYHRIWLPGGTYFFTLVTNHRKPIFHESFARDALHEAFLVGKEKVGSFRIDAICLLPDHLHCIWTLPENDNDYFTRWKVIKACFSRKYLQRGGIPNGISFGRIQKGDVGVWQRRFWEHTIKDQQDLIRHVEYIHFNPVKHGLAHSVIEWPWSSFHQYVKDGLYGEDWGAQYRETDNFSINE